MKRNETKMKVTISQPMNGIPDSEVRRIQKELKENFAKYGIEVIGSFLTDSMNVTAEPDSEIKNLSLFYLGRTIQRFLSDVDAVYFVDGWENAKGCRVERKICEEYGIMMLDNSFFNEKRTEMNIEKKVDIGKPAYYVEGRKYEPKDVIREFNFNFNLGCAVKYISRAGRKDPSKHVEDLKKALNYLQFEQSAIYNNFFNTTADKPDEIYTRRLNIDDGVAYYKMAKVSFDWNLSDELSLALMNLVSCQITNYNTFVYFYIEKAIGCIGDEISNITSSDAPEGTVR